MFMSNTIVFETSNQGSLVEIREIVKEEITLGLSTVDLIVIRIQQDLYYCFPLAVEYMMDGQVLLCNTAPHICIYAHMKYQTSV